MLISACVVGYGQDGPNDNVLISACVVGYGQAGLTGRIPPNAVLVFDVTLESCSKPKVGISICCGHRMVLIPGQRCGR